MAEHDEPHINVRTAVNVLGVADAHKVALKILFPLLMQDVRERDTNFVLGSGSEA